LPSLTQHQHFRALTEELTENTDIAGVTLKGRRLLKLLGTGINTILDPPPVSDKQRVILDHQKAAREEEQRVIDESPIVMFLRLTDAPPIKLIQRLNAIYAKHPASIDGSRAITYQASPGRRQPLNRSQKYLCKLNGPARS
jgi:hypothetical protein